MVQAARGAHSPVEHDAFSYEDGHGVEITAYEWAAADPHAVVQIAHGVGEHALRYAAFAQALTENGFHVYADDHRGHGRTGMAQWRGDRSKLGRLGPGGLRAAEDAVQGLTGIARARFPDLPLIMFAHSWGSLMTQRIMNRTPDAFDAVVLSGSAYRTPRHMESGDLNRRFRAVDASGFEWLSRDEEAVTAFVNDPLCFSADVLRLFGLSDALRLYGRPRAGLPTELPLLIISGAADALSRGLGLERLADRYRSIGLRDVTLKTYADARHELLNETNRDEVTEFIITWMLERFPRE